MTEEIEFLNNHIAIREKLIEKTVHVTDKNPNQHNLNMLKRIKAIVEEHAIHKTILESIRDEINKMQKLSKDS